jgi:hypothetical protein
MRNANGEVCGSDKNVRFYQKQKILWLVIATYRVLHKLIAHFYDPTTQQSTAREQEENMPKS